MNGPRGVTLEILDGNGVWVPTGSEMTPSGALHWLAGYARGATPPRAPARALYTPEKGGSPSPRWLFAEVLPEGDVRSDVNKWVD